MPIVITAIEKKGPVIICSTDDPKNRTYKLDFQNAKIFGITGKTLNSTCTIISKIPDDLARGNILFYALCVFQYNSYCQNTSYYAVVESLLSYPDLIPSQIDTGMIRYIINKFNGNLPKGYVAWCRKKSVKFALDTLKDFATEQILHQWPQSLVDSIDRFYAGIGINLPEETNYDKELCISLLRITNNSLKRYQIQGLFDHLRSILLILHDNPGLRPYLDDTKNAETAWQILDYAVNEERNNKMLANEAKIDALNGTLIGDLVIKVPSTMSDFTEEGEQQHNCVGYYYHDAIADGSTLIYFLRHAENPDKSYVTCRYRIERKETVEHRLKNNDWFIEDDLFKKIDSMIADVLGI